MSELLAVQSELSKTKQGYYLLRNLDVDGYADAIYCIVECPDLLLFFTILFNISINEEFINQIFTNENIILDTSFFCSHLKAYELEFVI